LAEAVILMGFMGSGKSAVGAGLAKKTGLGFIDCDPLVEESMGMTIADAFENEGEGFFRRQEEGVILGLLERIKDGHEGRVVSLGGGAVTSGKVRDRLREEEYCVWLDVGVEAAYSRAKGSDRPLAQDKEKFYALFEKRTKMYREVASMEVNVGNKTVTEIVDEVLMKLREAGLR
jgi:shikimate kinase